MTRSFLPGPARQIGYVVRDLDKAIESWLSIGVGPWFTMRDMTLAANFRGEPITFRTSLGLSYVGDMQIELIHQLDDVPTIHKEFLDSGLADASGYNQFAWWVDNYDEVLAMAQDAGWDISFTSSAGGSRYFYAQVPGTPMPTVEVMEQTAQTTGAMQMIREAAATWDGVTEPIRSVF